MSENNDVQYGGGIGFGGLLTIVFIVLKLMHIINWSWWWVLAPSWIPLSIVLFLLIAMAIIVVIGGRS